MSSSTGTIAFGSDLRCGRDDPVDGHVGDLMGPLDADAAAGLHDARV
jgi:hypothetical protein